MDIFGRNINFRSEEDRRLYVLLTILLIVLYLGTIFGISLYFLLGLL